MEKTKLIWERTRVAISILNKSLRNFLMYRKLPYYLRIRDQNK